MKNLAGYSLLLIACVSASQSSGEFHSRYGEPDIERFNIREGIGLTVLYGPDRHACQMEVKAPQLIVQQPTKKRMPSEVVEEILNEIAPAENRGRKISDLMQQMSCAREDIEYFETVTIFRSRDDCVQPRAEGLESVRVVFSRKECPSTGLRQ